MSVGCSQFQKYKWSDVESRFFHQPLGSKYPRASICLLPSAPQHLGTAPDIWLERHTLNTWYTN